MTKPDLIHQKAGALFGLRVDTLLAEPFAGYRAVQKNYLLLFTCASGGLWDKELFELGNRLGVEPKIKLTSTAQRDQYVIELIAARDLLLDWLDPDAQFTDELSMRVDPENQFQGKLIIKIAVNGFVVPNVDYCLEVDSYFSSLAPLGTDWSPNTVSFLGGCGIQACCGVGYRARDAYSYWNWFSLKINPSTGLTSDLRLAWSDVLQVGMSIIPEIEKLTEQSSLLYSTLTPRLPSYRKIIGELKAIVETRI